MAQEERYVNGTGVKTGLVLEGGAMRGLFTAGVLDVMMEHGIAYDGAVGVSAGASFGCNYKSRQIGRTIRYNVRFAKNWRYCSWRSLLLTGDLYGGQFCYTILPHELDIWDQKTFAGNPMEFYCVCTLTDSGRPVYHRCRRGDDRDLQWIRGSASMPGFAKPVLIDGYSLLDGGITDSIPLRFFQSKGYQKNVVVLTQPRDYVKTQSRLIPLMKVALHRYPAIARDLERRARSYNHTRRYIAQQELEGKVFAIYPPQKLEIGKVEHDPEKMKAVYEIGRLEAEKRMADLETFIGSGS